MTDPVFVEIRDLLIEIRDLLVPVAGASEEAHAAQKVVNTRKEQIRALLTTDKKRSAWALADGSLSQRRISEQSGLDEGNTSKFFKQLRALQGVDEGTNPKRLVEVE